MERPMMANKLRAPRQVSLKMRNNDGATWVGGVLATAVSRLASRDGSEKFTRFDMGLLGETLSAGAVTM